MRAFMASSAFLTAGGSSGSAGAVVRGDDALLVAFTSGAAEGEAALGSVGCYRLEGLPVHPLGLEPARYNVVPLPE